MPDRSEAEQFMQKALAKAAACAGLAAALIGVVYLSAWMTGTIACLGNSDNCVKPNASLCILLCGISLALVVRQPPPSKKISYIAALLAASVIIIAGLTIVEEATGIDLSIDELLAPKLAGPVTAGMYRMTPQGAVSFCICGAALLLLAFGKRRAVKISQALGVVLILTGILALIGRLYHVQGFFGIARFTAMARETTLTVLLLGAGILCARPRVGVVAVMTSNDAGGITIRRLLLPSVAVAVLLGWLRLEGERLDLYETGFGTSLLVLSWIIIFSLMIFHTGKRLSTIAAAERNAAEELKRTQTMLLEAESLSHTGAWEWDLEAGRWTFSDEWLRIHGAKERNLKPEELLAIAHPDDRAAIDQALEVLRQGIAPYKMEHRIIRRDTGELRIVNSQGQFVKAPGGEVKRVYGFVQDITEAKRAEEELRLQRELLESVVDHLPAGLLIVRGSDLRVLMANQAYQEFAPGKEILNRTIVEIWPEVHPHLADIFRTVLESGEPFFADDQPYRIRRSPDAPLEERFFTWSLYRVQLPGDQGFGVLNTAWETTERKRWAEALQHSENRLRSIIEHLSEGLLAIDLAGGALYWNRMALEMHQYTGEEDELGFVDRMAEKYELRIPGGEPVPFEQWPVNRILRGERLKDLELVVRDKERNWQRIYSYSGSAVADDAGKAEMALLTIRDVTEKMAAEEGLRESEEKFRAVFQQAAVGMGRVSFTDARWTDVNDAFCRMLGYSREEMLATPWPRMTHPDDLELDLAPFLEMSAGRLGSYSVEKRFIHRDGHHIWARLTLSLVRDAQGAPDYEIAVIEDITAGKVAEEEVRRARDELEMRVRERTLELERAYAELKRETEERVAAVEDLRKNEQLLIQQSRLAALGEMLGNIAHQWRQPLNYLGLLIQQLPFSQELGELTGQHLADEVAKAMRVIVEMSHTIDDFSQFLQPHKERASFSVNDAVAATVTLFEEAFRTMSVEVQVEQREDLLIEGRRNEFCQVIMNILMNARDAFRDRETKNPRIVITLGREDGKSVVTIADNAGGIAAEIADRIFDPYFTTKGPDKGTGIGLFMSKNIIEKSMKGVLSFRNTGEGAEFRIEV